MTVETNLTIRKLAKTITRPTKPFRSLVEAELAFLGSPVENMYSQPAIMVFTKKTTPAAKIRRLIMLKLVPEPLLLVRMSAKLLSGSMFLAGFCPLMVSITLMRVL